MLNTKFLVLGILSTFVPGFVVAAVVLSPRSHTAAAPVAYTQPAVRAEIAPLPVADTVTEEEPAAEPEPVAEVAPDTTHWPEAAFRPLVVKGSAAKSPQPKSRALKLFNAMNHRLDAMAHDGGVE